MTTITQAEGIRICAERDGWIQVERVESINLIKGKKPKDSRHYSTEYLDGRQEVPRYDSDYNALMPLIQKQDFDVKLKMEVEYMNKLESYFWYDATPQQLFTALLAAWDYKVEEK